MKAWLRWILCGMVLLVPDTLSAQVLNGAAEWSVVRGSQTSGDGVDAREQLVLAAVHASVSRRPSSIPRLAKCSVEASFRTTALSTGPETATSDGHQKDVGYNIGASAFPARPFPFFFQATRDTIGESGNFPSSSGIRGGLAVPTGAVPADFQTHNSSLNLGWQLNAVGLPRVELGYRSSRSEVAGGTFDASQADASAALRRVPGRRTHAPVAALRAHRVREHGVAGVRSADQRPQLRHVLRAQPRNARARARRAARHVLAASTSRHRSSTPASAATVRPRVGQVDTEYALGGITYDPSPRVSFDFSGNMDHAGRRPRRDQRQAGDGDRAVRRRAGPVAERGRHLRQPRPGDRRRQPLTRAHRNRPGGRHATGSRVQRLEVSVGGTRGIGSINSAAGDSGRLQSWSAQTGLSLSTPWIGLSGGLDRSVSIDPILVFGNYENTAPVRRRAERHRPRVAVGLRRGLDRGPRGGASLSGNHLQTFRASAGYRSTDYTISADAGQFKNRSDAWPRRHLVLGRRVPGQVAQRGADVGLGATRAPDLDADRPRPAEHRVVRGRQLSLPAVPVRSRVPENQSGPARTAARRAVRVPRPSGDHEASRASSGSRCEVHDRSVRLPRRCCWLSACGRPARRRRSQQPSRPPSWPPPPEPARIRFVRSIDPAAVRGKPSLFSKVLRVLIGDREEPRMRAAVRRRGRPGRHGLRRRHLRPRHPRLRPEEARHTASINVDGGSLIGVGGRRRAPVRDRLGLGAPDVRSICKGKVQWTLGPKQGLRAPDRPRRRRRSPLRRRHAAAPRRHGVVHRRRCWERFGTRGSGAGRVQLPDQHRPRRRRPAATSPTR